MKYLLRILTPALIGMLFLQIMTASGQEKQEKEVWRGKLADGKVITKVDLSKIIADHKKWLESYGKDGKQADLSEANLSGVRLSGANLSGANLTEANLDGINLKDVGLVGTNLKGADLVGADLSGADLSEANLSGAILVGADLGRASLSDADLNGANLGEANLREAFLGGTKLSKAFLGWADLSGAWFEPVTIEEITIGGAMGLSTIKFDDPKAAVNLRKTAKEIGLRNEERALTSALRKFQLQNAAWYVQHFERYALGGKLTDYGAQPWNSLVLLLGLIIPFSIVYIVALKGRGRDGIWKVWSPDRVRSDLGEDKPIRLNLRGFKAWRTGLYFSLLSAFHIGWRELNVGNWISRIQSREYNLRATGWVRTVSGIQSLLSVYLLALWALTYFGRPFE